MSFDDWFDGRIIGGGILDNCENKVSNLVNLVLESQEEHVIPSRSSNLVLEPQEEYVIPSPSSNLKYSTFSFKGGEKYDVMVNPRFIEDQANHNYRILEKLPQTFESLSVDDVLYGSNLPKYIRRLGGGVYKLSIPCNGKKGGRGLMHLDKDKGKVYLWSPLDACSREKDWIKYLIKLDQIEIENVKGKCKPISS